MKQIATIIATMNLSAMEPMMPKVSRDLEDVARNIIPGSRAIALKYDPVKFLNIINQCSDFSSLLFSAKAANAFHHKDTKESKAW